MCSFVHASPRQKSPSSSEKLLFITEEAQYVYIAGYERCRIEWMNLKYGSSTRTIAYFFFYPNIGCALWSRREVEPRSVPYSVILTFLGQVPLLNGLHFQKTGTNSNFRRFLRMLKSGEGNSPLDFSWWDTARPKQSSTFHASVQHWP